MPFQLPPLPYAKDALEPHISKETLEYHYGKHHATYVNNLNRLTEGKDEASKSLEDLIKTASGGILNNAGQVYNHTFYWNSMKAGGGGSPTGLIAGEIEKSFSSFEAFKEQFSAAAAGHFGSGWVWLCYCGEQKKVVITQTHDGGVPFRDNSKCFPLLACDVWEHAYYIDRRNDRAAYVKAWWSLVNWDFANENLKKAMAA
ncbi:superoxide dismutase, putative [Eimeria acervulina]|uniref:Superoxide dismutase n=1 Tax=Eimeria acervulina TaxID=5801 RepID=U6GZ51_EIMAC|nr:superoxide dismutase, putative [Eimeria acervulina]CDI84493.1 superoxide dismutase, putative [Eimeria acervulina]